MEVLKDSYPINANMNTVPLSAQWQRDRLGEGWEPNGFKRYEYQRELLQRMPTVGGGPGDTLMGNPDRYEPVSPTMEVDFPVPLHTTKRKK